MTVIVCCFTASEKAAKGYVLVPVVDEAAVNLVGDDVETVPDGQFGDPPEVFFFHDPAGRIVRVAQDHHLRPGGDLFRHLLGTEPEIILHLPLDQDGYAVGQLHLLRVAHPAGDRDDDLVSRGPGGRSWLR